MILTEFFSLVTEMSVSKNNLTGFVTPKKQEDIVALRNWDDTSGEFELESETLSINKKLEFSQSLIISLLNTPISFISSIKNPKSLLSHKCIDNRL